jgi:hypothetical protein
METKKIKKTKKRKVPKNINELIKRLENPTKEDREAIQALYKKISKTDSKKLDFKITI